MHEAEFIRTEVSQPKGKPIWINRLNCVAESAPRANVYDGTLITDARGSANVVGSLEWTSRLQEPNDSDNVVLSKHRYMRKRFLRNVQMLGRAA